MRSTGRLRSNHNKYMHVSGGATIPILTTTTTILILVFSLFAGSSQWPLQWQWQQWRQWRHPLWEFCGDSNQRYGESPGSVDIAIPKSNSKPTPGPLSKPWAITVPFHVSPLEASNPNSNTHTRPPRPRPRPMTDAPNSDETKDPTTYNTTTHNDNNDNDNTNIDTTSTSVSTSTSTTLTKGVRAVKTFLIRQFDDYQFLTVFSTAPPNPASLKTPTTPSHLSPAAAVSSFTPISAENGSQGQIPSRSYTHTNTTTTTDTDQTNKEQLTTHSAETGWQVLHRYYCYFWSDFLRGRGSSFRFPTIGSYLGTGDTKGKFPHADDNPSMTSTRELGLREDDQAEIHKRARHNDTRNGSSKIRPDESVIPPGNSSRSRVIIPQSQTQYTTTPIDGVGRNEPGNLRGSSMAIIVGLVVGIMWF